MFWWSFLEVFQTGANKISKKKLTSVSANGQAASNTCVSQDREGLGGDGVERSIHFARCFVYLVGPSKSLYGVMWAWWFVWVSGGDVPLPFNFSCLEFKASKILDKKRGNTKMKLHVFDYDYWHLYPRFSWRIINFSINLLTVKTQKQEPSHSLQVCEMPLVLQSTTVEPAAFEQLMQREQMRLHLMVLKDTCTFLGGVKVGA